MGTFNLGQKFPIKMTSTNKLILFNNSDLNQISQFGDVNTDFNNFACRPHIHHISRHQNAVLVVNRFLMVIVKFLAYTGKTEKYFVVVVESDVEPVRRTHIAEHGVDEKLQKVSSFTPTHHEELIVHHNQPTTVALSRVPRQTPIGNCIAAIPRKLANIHVTLQLQPVSLPIARHGRDDGERTRLRAVIAVFVRRNFIPVAEKSAALVHVLAREQHLMDDVFERVISERRFLATTFWTPGHFFEAQVAVTVTVYAHPDRRTHIVATFFALQLLEQVLSF